MSEVTPLGEVQKLPINTLKPAPHNPRQISKKAVEITAKSIKRFGWQQPIIVDRERIIIAGHTRLKAAKALGLTHAPVIIASNLTPEEADAYRIADNRTSDYTTWDYPQLAEQLEALSEDFADELDLADWQGIIDEFTDQQSNELASLSLDEEAEQALTKEHSLVVVLRTEHALKQLESELADRKEVIDVRYKR